MSSSPASDRWSAVLQRRGDAREILQLDTSALVLQDDKSLMQALQLGEVHALGILFERYYRLVWTIGFRILGERIEADDFAQDVFLCLFERSQRYDGAKGDVRRWLVAVTYNLAFDRLDYLRARRTGMHDELNERRVLHSRLSAKGSSNASEATVLRSQLNTILKCLPLEQQKTICMHIYEGYTFHEISERLGQSYGTVRHHYYRGLELLRTNAYGKKAGSERKQ